MYLHDERQANNYKNHYMTLAHNLLPLDVYVPVIYVKESFATFILLGNYYIFQYHDIYCNSSNTIHHYFLNAQYQTVHNDLFGIHGMSHHQNSHVPMPYAKLSKKNLRWV